MAAFTIPSETNNTRSEINKLFEFLSDFKNFKAILPEDKVENFEYAGDQCSFNIKGITPMTIRLKEKKPFEYILFSSEGLAKFNFSLKVTFAGSESEKGTCQVDLMGDLNPIIKTMAEKPLAGLVNTMSSRLGALEL